jgi:hypothetical protein
MPIDKYSHMQNKICCRFLSYMTTLSIAERLKQLLTVPFRAGLQWIGALTKLGRGAGQWQQLLKTQSGATDVPDSYCRMLNEGTIREFALLLSP